MSTRGFLPTVLFAFLSLLSMGSDVTPLSTSEWQTNTYPEIGLKLQIPQSKAVIKDQQTRWSLFAYQVREDPVPGNRYRFQLSIEKLSCDEYVKLSRKYGTNSIHDWGNSAHPEVNQRSNQFWIVMRRDVRGTNGFVYRFDGAIQRFQRSAPERLKAIGGEDEKLVAEMSRVLETVEVVYAKPTTKLSSF